MKIRMLFATAIVCCSLLVSGNQSFGQAESVTVNRGGLVHTRMLTANNGEFADLAGQITGIARDFDASLSDVAKLNLYVSDSSSDSLDAIHAGFEKTWPKSGKQPALTLIPTTLPSKEKLAGDAVIGVKDGGQTEVERFKRDAALLPANKDVVYISGKAASGGLQEATAGTMVQLFDVLHHLDAEKKDVVQVKAFIKPMAGWEFVEAEIEKSFGELGAPPIIFVEWNSGSRATEIELIAAAPKSKNPEGPISYFTPTKEKASPVYSRVGRVHGDKIIYLSGMTGLKNENAAAEVRSIFDDLKRIAVATQSDLRHFAKATYYVSDKDASTALNALRPDYYDPERPPAASKVQVPTIGVEGCGILIDMITVPST